MENETSSQHGMGHVSKATRRQHARCISGPVLAIWEVTNLREQSRSRSAVWKGGSRVVADGWHGWSWRQFCLVNGLGDP